MLLHITPSVRCADFPRYGGVEIYIDEICRRIGKSMGLAVLNGKHDLTRPRKEVFSNYVAYHVPVTDFSNSFPASALNIPLAILSNVATSGELYLASRALDADLLHIHESHTHLLSAIRTDKPKVFTFHGSHTAIPYERQTFHAKRLYWDWDSFVARRCDHVFAVSSLCKRNIVAHLGIEAEKVSVTHHGVDYERFRPVKTGLKERICGGDGPLIVDVTRLAMDKGLHLTVQAVASLKKRHPHVKCVFCGVAREDLQNSDYGRHLLGMIEKEGLSGRVLFPGRIRNHLLPEYLSAADAFVHPASVEAFGIAIGEAMACERPAVCLKNSGGPDDMIAHGKNGFLLKQNVPEIAETVEFLLDNPSSAKRMGREARKRILADFTWDKTAERTAEAYHSLV